MCIRTFTVLLLLATYCGTSQSVKELRNFVLFERGIESGATFASGGPFAPHLTAAALLPKFSNWSRNGLAQALQRAAGLPVIEFEAHRPSALFPPAPEAFDLLHQLQMDELAEAEAEAAAQATKSPVVEFQNSQQLKFGKKVKKRKKRKRKRKKKKNKKRKQKPVGDPAQLLFTTAHQKPWQTPWQTTPKTTTTTRKPQKLKYIIRKKNALKKKKKEYINHLKHVIYPFVKFIAFFTVLNPFTFVVFLFALISPVVFGGLGFLALSFLIKPALHLLFDVKRRVDTIHSKKWREKRRRERWRHSRRPITIHKHYYKNWILPKTKTDKVVFNPILPQVKDKIKHSHESSWPPFLVRR